MAELSYEEVVGILGSLGDFIIAEVIATGINKEGLEAARARVVRDRKAHNPGPPLEPGPFALVVDILERSRGRGILGEAGSPRWGLAPIEMAWEGKSVGEICAQLKDPGRNGGRNLTLLHEHLATDDLVAWGWNSGLGRDPAPGTQARLGELIKAWIDTGAQCPH